MEIHFTPEEEALLSKIATHAGTNPEQMVRNAALQLIQEDARFLAAVEKGMAEAERGELIDEEEVDARVRKMLES